MTPRKDDAPVDGSASEAANADESPRYVAPAVEKGLDVIELLAAAPEALSQRQVAERLGRSVPEVYRVLASLERRGYIARDLDEAYRLTMKLHQLAMTHPPVSRLIDAAALPMRQLALDTMQSFHLTVLDGVEIQAVFQVDSPAPVGFRVRVGGRNAAIRSASGRTLLAFQRQAVRDWVLDRSVNPPRDDENWRWVVARIEDVKAAGYEYIVEDTLKGIIDVSFPIVDYSGFAVAALTMPFLAAHAPPVPVERAAELTLEAARRISALLGGAQPEPSPPLSEMKSSS